MLLIVDNFKQGEIKMTIKILTLISIWYVFYFLLNIIVIAIVRQNNVLPRLAINLFSWRIDLLGNNVFTFMASFMFLIWTYIIN
jgi:hypothetical protein